MTHISKKHPFIHRAFAWVLAMVLLLPLFSVAGFATEDLQGVRISLSWNDENGEVQSYQANMLSWQAGGFWATLPPQAPLDQLTLNIYDEMNPQRSYYLWGSTLIEPDMPIQLQDSGTAVNPQTGLSIEVRDENGNPLNIQYTLYASTSSEQPPDPPSAQVTVLYQSADGSLNESETVTLSASIPKPVISYKNLEDRGYRFIGAQESYEIDVQQEGVANPSSVVFEYEPTAEPEPEVITQNIAIHYLFDSQPISDSTQVTLTNQEGSNQAYV
ncbi:MAG: hypothetical protein GX786_00715, partial [Clostridiales bacterium]|nr:hypothetical protein [Clostridiales bacterium]